MSDLINKTLRELLGIKPRELIMEYSGKIITNLIAKFKLERPTLSDEQIKYYIDRFEKLKASPKVIEKDITKYSFANLEKVVDSFPKKGEVINKNLNTAQVKGEEVYAKNGIEVYFGDSRDKCVRYKTAFQGDTGQQYGWCIARGDSSNMFTSYRYGYGEERIFYFVIDRNKPITDPFHVFVVHVFDGGLYGITNARNDGDNTNLTWEQMVELVPTLRKIPKSIFKSKRLTPEEIELYNQTKEYVKDGDLFKHFNNKYELVKAYIEIHNHNLTNSQIDTLVNQKQFDIINLYINTGKEIYYTTLNKLPEQLIKNYARVGNQLMEHGEGAYTLGIRFILMYVYGFIDKERFIEILKHENNGITEILMREIIGINRLDILKLLFGNIPLSEWDRGMDIGTFPQNIQILYAQSGKDYLKNTGNLDLAHAQIMWFLNIDANLADDYFPYQRLLPKIQKLNPEIIDFSVGFKYANRTIAIAGTIKGNEFVNKNGESDTNGITNDDLSRMSNYYIELYFKQRFNISYKIEKYYQKNPNFAKPYASTGEGIEMFIGSDNKGDISGIDFNKLLDKTNKIGIHDIGAYANAILNRFYYRNVYFRQMMPKGLNYKKEMALGLIGTQFKSKYVIVDPETWRPSLEGVTINNPDDETNVKCYNNTIEAMKDFGEPVPAGNISESKFLGLLKNVYKD